LWAVSEQQASNASIIGKARKLPVGAFGIFYCVETHSFTVPFVIRSRPDMDEAISNVWPERWRLPFQIVPLGTPRKRTSKNGLVSLLPGLRASGKNWHHYFHVEGTTVFAPSEIDEGDWHILFQELADL
jgi:hypothetical protein